MCVEVRDEMDSWQVFGRKGPQQREVTALSHPGLFKEAVGLFSIILPASKCVGVFSALKPKQWPHLPWILPSWHSFIPPWCFFIFTLSFLTIPEEAVWLLWHHHRPPRNMEGEDLSRVLANQIFPFSSFASPCVYLFIHLFFWMDILCSWVSS